jgi:putative inorganic carbon (hco3(-)) transporter
MAKDNLLRSLGFYLLLALVLMIPFYKQYADVPIALMFVLWLSRFFIPSGSSAPKRFSGGLLSALLVLFLLIAFVSVFFSASFGVSFRAFWGKWAKYIFVFFFVRETVGDRTKLERLLSAVYVSVSLVCAAAFFQYVKGVDFFMGQGLEDLQWMTGPFKTNNTFGLFLVLFLPVVLAGMLQAKEKAKRFFLAALLGMMAVCLVFSYSAMSWIALTASGIVSAFVFKSARPVRWFVLAFFACLWSLLLLNPVFHGRIGMVADKPSMQASYGRLGIWKETVKEISARPVFGMGINSFRTSVLGRFNPKLDKMGAHCHNLYLQIAFEMGIPAMIVFLFIFGLIFKQSLAVSGSGDGYAAAVSCGFYSYAFIALMDTHSDPRMQVIFWMYAALLVLLARRQGEREKGLLQE